MTTRHLQVVVAARIKNRETAAGKQQQPRASAIYLIQVEALRGGRVLHSGACPRADRLD